jgi:dienelactone hydrolase
MGGALSISAASYIPGFDACAPFYGIPDLTKIPIKNLTCRFQGHFGELDAMKPFSDP